jgi:hypothetical protein
MAAVAMVIRRSRSTVMAVLMMRDELECLKIDLDRGLGRWR